MYGPFSVEMGHVDTDFHSKFDIKSANYLKSIKLTGKVEPSVLNLIKLV